ncbi:DUF6226 family protein [Arthrobacter wenxiniae]|uniref:Uncharacterized protein n=1 Tax=Arthrobacter wenxiniae TaxID=2713570 RepID=A0A7Y7LY68_9MICC|nr:hypothetical protein [Arthrobacter wenxiniae]
MSQYRRPSFPTLAYRDGHGLPIEYGRRWDSGSAPGDAYSRTSNLQRFAPLHNAATALVEWLQATVDVAVQDRPVAANELLPQPERVRQGRIRLPPHGNCSPWP